MAKDFKKYVEDNQKAPYKLTYHNTEYDTRDMIYAFVYGLYHLKSNFDIPANIQWAKNANGDKVSEKIGIDDYKKQALNVYNYIIKNKRIPDYVSTINSGKKVNIDLFAYCMSKVLIYYKEKGQLPSTCQYNYMVLQVPMVSIETLGSIASQVKSYVEKNYAVPDEINGYRHGEYTYLFCQIISNGGILLQRKGVGMAKNPSGDNLKMDIYKSHYVRLAKKLVEYVDENKQLPNFITLENHKIKVNLYEYMFAKIVNYYVTNKELPSKVSIDINDFVKPVPKPVVKKYGRSRETGCDNRGQNNGYYCGPHMVQEIIRNLTGKVISQSTLASVIGTTSDGSGHYGIDTAFAWFNRNYDYNLQVQWKNFSDLGWSGINEILESNNKDMGAHELYRNRYGHYTNFDDIYGSTIDVHNSLGSYCNYGCYCGYTENRSKGEAEDYLGGISQKSILIVTRK